MENGLTDGLNNDLNGCTGTALRRRDADRRIQMMNYPGDRVMLESAELGARSAIGPAAKHDRPAIKARRNRVGMPRQTFGPGMRGERGMFWNECTPSRLRFSSSRVLVGI
ncbi:hypothetical protein J6590_024160 [Homalodisca vitripennis]|nr:hypothetical protein J6590_024160 [Homalodisca vitripennis]